MSNVTELLAQWGRGDEAALDRIVPLVHQELHQIARRHMARERGDHTLQPTALVNETYLRLVDAKNVTWHDRAHFLAVCAQVMRRVLVDHARGRRSQKRGGDVPMVSFDDDLVVPEGRRHDVVALDDALNALSQFDARKSRVVELRCFGGLTVEETAAVVKVSQDTVMRDWKLAKAWLQRELR
jgi:RNA polymerase sigma-70 factor, ECF subfamily